MSKISTDWLISPASQRVCRLLSDQGYQALFVGGCVRNALLDVPVSDLDIATDAHPEIVTQLAKDARIRSIPTGIEHGTVTLIVDDIPFEITTFRRDVSTDGRRATVAFSSDIAEDAKRRDFTMNALYADRDGVVLDPLDGLPDLQARRLRFIGDGGERIREDYLRILRFFRFHAIYGDPGSGIDADGLAACAQLAEGLEQISAERIGAEMRKLLGADDPAPSVAAMAAAGVLARVLPGADPTALAPLMHLEGGAELIPQWPRRLCSLGLVNWKDNLRLSRVEQRYQNGLHTCLREEMGAAVAAYRFGADTARDTVFCRAAMAGGVPVANWQGETARGAAAKFPVSAGDLLKTMSAGPQLGVRLKAMEAAWIASDFSLEKPALLAIDTSGGL